MTSLELANLICGIIDDKKGKDIVKIEVSKVSSLCDYFIIASGNSVANVKAIAEEIEEKLTKNEIFVKRTEGVKEGRWVAMDYGDVIVHIFNDETRLFYHIEKIWEQGNVSHFMQAVAAGKEEGVEKSADKKVKEVKAKKEKEPANEKNPVKKPVKKPAKK